MNKLQLFLAKAKLIFCGLENICQKVKYKSGRTINKGKVNKMIIFMNSAFVCIFRNIFPRMM